MKHIQFTVKLTDEYKIRSVAINSNDTGLPSDHTLIEQVSVELFKTIHYNKQCMEFRDMLLGSGIKLIEP